MEDGTVVASGHVTFEESERTPANERSVARRLLAWLRCSDELAELARAHSALSKTQQQALEAAQSHLAWAEEIARASRWLAPPRSAGSARLLLEEAWRHAAAAAPGPSPELPRDIGVREVRAMLAAAEPWLPALAEVSQRRVLRHVAAALLLALGCAVPCAAAHAAFHENKAFGKAWQLSAAAPDVDPIRHTLAGVDRGTLFETRGPDAQWAKLDLREPTWLWGLQLSGAAPCPTLAGPIRVETSMDDRTWQSLASSPSSVERWARWFWPRQARYVRLSLEGPASLCVGAVELR